MMQLNISMQRFFITTSMEVAVDELCGLIPGIETTFENFQSFRKIEFIF